jgi:glycosyltransferase involved in cell wall biosynthesis
MPATIEQISIPQPLISVVVAFLNEEKFLKETVDSVLNQNYTKWELLLVDDGSTDKSTAFAKELANTNVKIKYCEHPNHINMGLSASRNLGIKSSNGNYVAFLDADDVWLPNKLTEQVAIFEKNKGIGMIAEASLYWETWSNNQCLDTNIEVGVIQDKIHSPMSLSYELYPLGEGAAPVPSGLMLTRKAIDEVGGFEETFRKQYSLYEDQAFLSKIYLTQKVYVSSKSNNLYRQRPESIVKSVKADGQYDNVRKYFLEWFQSYIDRNNINDIKLRALLGKALLPYHKPFEHWLTKTLPKTFKKVVKKVLPR